jgi:hypothetical protein
MMYIVNYWTGYAQVTIQTKEFPEIINVLGRIRMK